MTLTIKQALASGSELREVSASWQLDTQLLLASVLQTSRSHLFTWPEQDLQAAEHDTFRQLLARRSKGEPIAYILGKQAFWDFDLWVNPSVLIPRPETEQLVEKALELLPRGAASSITIADLGTGSGAIALALATTNRKWNLLAVDASEEALATARSNAESLSVSNIEFQLASWCEALSDESCDLLIANPPYVAANDPHLNEGDLVFEPKSALVAADNGLADIAQIVEQSRRVLKNEAWLLLEHGYNQKLEVAAILKAAGFVDIQSQQDYSGVDRMTFARWKN